MYSCVRQDPPPVVPNQVKKLETQDHLPCRPKYKQMPNHGWSPASACTVDGQRRGRRLRLGASVDGQRRRTVALVRATARITRRWRWPAGVAKRSERQREMAAAG